MVRVSPASKFITNQAVPNRITFSQVTPMLIKIVSPVKEVQQSQPPKPLKLPEPNQSKSQKKVAKLSKM